MKYINILISLLFCPSIYAQDIIEHILQDITSNNLELRALQHENNARIHELKSENTLSGPSIEYSPFYTKGYHGMASSEMIISQEFNFPSLYAQRRQQTQLESRAMESAYEQKRREILLEARLTIYDIIRQNQIIDLLEQRRNQGETVEHLLEQRLTAGDATILEFNKAKLELMQTRQELVNEENNRTVLLKQLCMMNGGKDLVVTEHRFPEVREDLSSLSFTTLLPEVEQAQRELEISQYNVRTAKKSWLPSFNLGYRRNTEENSKLHGFLVGASFPIYSTPNRIKSARLQLQSQELRLEAAKMEAEGSQKIRLEELLRLQKVLDHSDTQLLNTTLQLLGKAMENGQITVLEYYTECNDIYSKLSNHISLHCEYVKQYASLFMR